MKRLFIWVLVILCVSCTRHQSEITEKGDFSRIPLFFLSCSTTPLLKAEIEGRIVSLRLDSGATCDLALKERILEKIQDKEFKGISGTFNGHGKRHEAAQYLIPSIKIGNLLINDALSGKETMEMVRESKIGHRKQKKIDEQFSQIDGLIGTGILSHLHCYFDLSHSTLYLAQSLAEIQKCYSANEFIEVPFELQNGHVILSAKTDFGVKKFLLDTGAGASIFRKSQISDTKKDWIKSKLLFGENDFGQWKFYLYDFTDRVPVDGVLGIDFFKKHSIHLDFEHGTAYIQLPRRSWRSLFQEIFN